MIVPLYPPLDGSAAERFPIFARALRDRQELGRRGELDAVIDAELAWCAKAHHLGDEQVIYEACVRVLADLVRLRWRIVEQGFGVALENPREVLRSRTQDEIIEVKRSLRAELAPVLNGYLSQDSVRAFIRRLETPRSGKHSVLKLVASGQELLNRLTPAMEAAGDERAPHLDAAIQPYLQLADDEIDPITGHTLREVWRYFRFTWSIPQVPTPGRQLLYLIRDAAHPDHPVIGITALNNCPLEMGERREVFIGWHRKALLDRFQQAATKGSDALEAEVAWLEGRLAHSLEEIDWTNLVSPEQVESPDNALVADLERKGENFARLRAELLRDIESRRAADVIDFEPADWLDTDAPPVDDEILLLDTTAGTDRRMLVVRKNLVAKKRASGLGRLLKARLALRRHRAALTDPAQTLATLEQDDVRGAVNIVLEALKARRAAANMLEITTCGAVEPYNHILGGKLAAMLMMSPQIAADYQRLYGAPSIISSQMRNRRVRRDNFLVFLGTTSLYVHGSSQYNRIRLPAGVIAADQGPLAFHEVGETSGFGTVQFSPETSRVMDEVLKAKLAYKQVNSVFGEGTSPKLRKLKAGMKTIGFDPDRLLMHRQRRLIYACPLMAEATDWLLERTTALPGYIARPEDFPDASAAIAQHWRNRWLAKRIDYEPVQVALREDKGWRLSERLPATAEAEPV